MSNRTEYLKTTHSKNERNFLKNALIINGLFSGVSGFFIMLFSQLINPLIGLDNYYGTWLLITIGALLALFSFTILVIAMQIEISKPWTSVIISLDSLWVIGSILLIIFTPIGITHTGQVLIVCIAFIVGIIAISQYIGLKNYQDLEAITHAI